MKKILTICAWGGSALAILGIVGTIERGGSLSLALWAIPAMIIFWATSMTLQP